MGCCHITLNPHHPAATLAVRNTARVSAMNLAANTRNTRDNTTESLRDCAASETYLCSSQGYFFGNGKSEGDKLDIQRADTGKRAGNLWEAIWEV